MARKQTEGRSLSTEGGNIPLGHRRPMRSKPAAAAEPAAVEPAVTAQPAAQVSDPISEREAIAKIAYFYWQERGGEGGCPEEDWLRAEQEYRRRQPESIR